MIYFICFCYKFINRYSYTNKRFRIIKTCGSASISKNSSQDVLIFKSFYTISMLN